MTSVPSSTVGLARLTGLLLGVVVAVLFTGCFDLPLKDISELQCEDLIPEIIDLSEERKNPLAPAILKIYNAEEVTRTSERLECEGDARWSSGEWRVAFHIEEDQEGDSFIGYESKRFD